VKHKPLRPPVSKNPKMPSPHRYSENEDEIETGEGGAYQQTSQQPAGTRMGTGLTGSPDQSDWSHLRQHSSRQKPSSPIKKLINLFVGMCKS